MEHDDELDLLLRKDSKYLQCPLPKSFFTKMGKRHSSEIRREIMKAWKYDRKQLQNHLRARLLQYGHLDVVQLPHANWEEAFTFADQWNRYPGFQKDKRFLIEKIKQGEWIVEKYVMTLDIPTLLTMASLAFHQDAEKESPNHVFLKELIRLYLLQFGVVKVEEEHIFTAYGETVRCDLKATIADTIELPFMSHLPNRMNNDKVVIAEIGGMQLWKVLLYMRLGYCLLVAPHWTRQKMNPFIRKNLDYVFITFTSLDES